MKFGVHFTPSSRRCRLKSPSLIDPSTIVELMCDSGPWKHPTPGGCSQFDIKFNRDEVACLPREFTIVIEEGSFAAVQGYRHEMRMTLDIWPYPALEAYNKQSGRSIRAEEIVPWLNEPRSFYAGQLPDEFEEGRAADDDTILGYHTSNCVMS